MSVRHYTLLQVTTVTTIAYLLYILSFFTQGGRASCLRVCFDAQCRFLRWSFNVIGLTETIRLIGDGERGAGTGTYK